MERVGEQREDRTGNRTTTQAKWTFLVYMAGDNNLDGAALRDIAEMAKAGSTKDVNILVQLDRIEDQLTRRFRIPQAPDDLEVGAGLPGARCHDLEDAISSCRWIWSSDLIAIH